MPLPLRVLGRDGPKVSAVGFGFGSLGGFYGPAGTFDEKLAVLEHALATGLRFWDMADVYADSEVVVRQPNGMHKFWSDPEYVKAACEKSLHRLGVDTIDLYYCHWVDGVRPIEKTVEALVELKNQGKIRYLGLSEVSAVTLRRAHAVHRIAALQMEYSLFTLDIKSSTSEILKTCRELGATVVAFSPIGRGVLRGHISKGDLRRMLPKFSKDNFPKILAVVHGLKNVACAHGSTPAQVTLAWLLAQGPDIIPTPGTKSTTRTYENAASALVQLSDQEVQGIRTLVEQMRLQGTRYSAA
ncbi:uncharacterized protein N7498_009267 [Penicillium cinerascens]|uniref:NADP-dependent oxidoreductase domain-containing protein n=1 Tax=Penicillium cinerascens TaxID=70096 RepID=A0A9W9M7T6_9EURO|nr:uncharacterized protein N7498_009267 [Penicillium cinerascens]KAJ5190282.1 hypothetical protein N7498_009267 [Penicillium cinerascens]